MHVSASSSSKPKSHLTNFHQLAVYDCRLSPNLTDEVHVARILLVGYDEFEARFDELWPLMSREAVYSGDFDRRFAVDVTRHGADQFDDFFLRQVRSWCERLATDIHHQVPGLSPDELTYAVQLFLSRIVFLRICEDRDIERYETLRGLTAGNSFDALMVELRRADAFYDSGLFRLLDDARLGIRISDDVLSGIINELYYPQSPYTFAVVETEVLGEIYEQFLGEIITIDAHGNVEIVSKPEVRDSGGVVPTPRFIVDAIVQRTLGPKLAGQSPADHAHTLSPRANLNHMTREPRAPVGTLTSTPAFYALVLEDPKFNATTLPGLHAFWIGGETVQRSLLLPLRERFPGCEIHHAYGPSECASITHAHMLTDEDLSGHGPLSLGPQKSGARVMVDFGAGLAPYGEGEVVLVGPQVGRCYWPLSHPNNANFTTHDGQRAYRTGDHGEIDAHGHLFIHGRIDNQVKVNGFRIELGEIERSAVQVGGVKQAVALQAAEGAVTRGLILVLDGEDIDDGRIGAVRQHLRYSLPPFMVPQRILLDRNLPLSHAGKIDRRAIKERFGMT